MKNIIPLSDRALSFLALAAGNNGNANSGDLAIINGHLDPPNLKAAIDLIAVRHPILKSKIVRKSFNYFWQYDESIRPELITLDWSHKFDSEDSWHNATRNLISQDAIDPFSGSPAKLYYIKFNHKSALLFVSAHCASDARSGYIILDEINQFLCGSLGEYTDNSFLEDKHNFSKPKFKDWLVTLFDLGRSLLSRKKTAVLPDTSSNYIEYINLGKPALNSLIKYAKEHGLTVNGALNQALSKALGSKNQHIIFETLSVRPHAKNDLDGAYNNLIIPFSSVIGGKNNWIADYSCHLANITKNNIHSLVALQKLQGYLVRLFPKKKLKLLSRLYQSLFLKGNVLLSNLGKLDFDLQTIAHKEVEAVYNYSVPLPPAGLAIVASSLNNEFRYTLAYRGKPGSIEHFKSEFKHHILELGKI
ncbi:hypothetical protein BGP78_09170 [Pseudoalteromonas sp. MSK9-3]|uniref:hypothetical protein n=1 Tax=Pseudoalteromonas sp. MSK9-3 TaxID=1897633 RepID=UPI000E6D4016|nr:hypothetical protein [Pseudoalteromonas sp. MSK9-3]RJE77220.1 hypothetical protein BGP78_09170 [Pseudoalteromonas sp. MSK9-3]